jgi:hypothetical protein
MRMIQQLCTAESTLAARPEDTCRFTSFVSLVSPPRLLDTQMETIIQDLLVVESSFSSNSTCKSMSSNTASPNAATMPRHHSRGLTFTSQTLM